MHRTVFICLLLLIIFQPTTWSQKDVKPKPVPDICLSTTEAELYRLINEYRVQKGLPEVKLSVSLCYVARTHAKDQTENYKESKRCNMHSWSNKGNWSPCCYTPDHRHAQFMWNKPRELTNYQGDGFEISFYSTYQYASPTAFARDILDGWKKSPGHNDVIINKKIWKNIQWEAIGIGVYGEYANVWFGKEVDTAGAPQPCTKE